ncbi:MAG: hypothetical protein GC193_13140 [Cryomorphaceae bacterium]|nr:hypothetical protein [Cryomorphaceae bacterium]
MKLFISYTDPVDENYEPYRKAAELRWELGLLAKKDIHSGDVEVALKEFEELGFEVVNFEWE